MRRLLVPSGVCAAASPPTRFPVQYSPALPWGTTRFGMELGGSMALSATHTPEGKSRRSSYSGNCHQQPQGIETSKAFQKMV